MSVIEGASVTARTLADGTLRLSIDIEPRNAQAAFVLFGAPGRAVALAALVDGAGSVQEHQETAGGAGAAQTKGGEWAKLAGMWCADKDFWVFWRSHFGDSITDPQMAAINLRELLCIESRAELDHDANALKRFNEYVRYPFMKYMTARGIQK